jgi:hypothetical protein
MAAAVTDRVRRSEARPLALSASGQRVDELLAAVLAAGHGEQRQQRDGLPGIEGDRGAVACHGRRAEQRQPQLRHRPPPQGSR